MRIKPGDRVIVVDAYGQETERRALTGLQQGDFKLIWVCYESEWESAQADGRDPVGTPWPIEDVRVVEPA